MPASTRTANTQKRNERLREAFWKRCTDQPRPRKHSKEVVMAQLCGRGGPKRGHGGGDSVDAGRGQQ